MTPKTNFKEPTVRISMKEYTKLLEYKAICQEMVEVLEAGDDL